MTSEKKKILVDRLEADRFAVRKRYDEWFEERMELLRSGAFEGLPESKGYLPDEKALYKQSEKLRRKLVELNPEKYHFGEMSRNLVLRKPRAVSKGDNGYFFCVECKMSFPYNDCLKARRGNGKVEVPKKLRLVNECFNSCEQHKGIKGVAKITLKKESEIWS